MRNPSASLTLAAALIGLAGTALASTSASSVSDSLTTSVGSASASIQHSSRASSGKADVAAGDYRVIAVTAATEAAGHARVTLLAEQGQVRASEAQPEVEALAATPAAAERFDLVLPDRAAAQAGLRVGQRVRVRAQAYGVEFATAPAHEAFYLVLHDASWRELRTQAVER